MNKVLEQEINDLHAQVCAALADPKRIMLVYELAAGPKNVTELGNTLGMPQPLVSRHLKVLRERGMVKTTRQGAAVEYRLADMRLVKALDLLRAVLHDTLSHRAQLATQWE